MRGSDGQEHGAVHRFLDPQMGQRAGPAVALQRPALARNPGLARAGRQQRHGDEGDGGDPGQAAARHRRSQWTGLSYEEQQSSGQAPALYGLSLLIVFLCLAALYESWTIPLAVMLVVPLGIVGALLGAKLTGLDNNIYLQVGLITTMGLAARTRS